MLLKIFFLIEASFVSLSFGHHPQERLLKNVVGGSFAIVSCVAGNAGEFNRTEETCFVIFCLREGQYCVFSKKCINEV